MGCPTTSAVSSGGRRMRSWVNSRQFRLCFMPTLTFPTLNRTTQVSVYAFTVTARATGSFLFFLNHTKYIIILSQTGPVGVNKS